MCNLNYFIFSHLNTDGVKRMELHVHNADQENDITVQKQELSLQLLHRGDRCTKMVIKEAYCLGIFWCSLMYLLSHESVYLASNQLSFNMLY